MIVAMAKQGPLRLRAGSYDLLRSVPAPFYRKITLVAGLCRIPTEPLMIGSVISGSVMAKSNFP